MAKLFLALYMPADNPFWTARETEGAWVKMNKKEPYNVYSEKAKTTIEDLARSELCQIELDDDDIHYSPDDHDLSCCPKNDDERLKINSWD